MRATRIESIVALYLLSSVPFWAVPALLSADDELEQRASWTVPEPGDVKAELDRWLADRELDELTRLKIEALWTEPSRSRTGLEALYLMLETVGVVDPRVAELVAQCRTPSAPTPPLPEHEVLQDENLAPVVRRNLRLLYGAWLAQQELYDEAGELLEGIRPEEVVDPASLLFYQGVVAHRLLKSEQCVAAVDRLLENEQRIPRRYGTVARLMAADIRPLKADSLDEVARLMDDIQRRLKLGRAGVRVRQQEDDVLAKLDKMIEELEKQRRQQNGGGAGSNNPSTPMQDSMPGGGTGPGDVDPRKLADGPNWGNLPQRERDEVLQQISKDLPAHYREVIKEYFRKIAR